MSKIYSPHHHRPNLPPNVLVSSVHPNDGGDQPAIWGYYDLELLSSSTSFLVKFQCLFNDGTIMRRPPLVHAYIRMSCLSRWGRLFSRMAMVMSMGGWWCRRVNIVLLHRHLLAFCCSDTHQDWRHWTASSHLIHWFFAKGGGSGAPMTIFTGVAFYYEAEKYFDWLLKINIKEIIFLGNSIYSFFTVKINFNRHLFLPQNSLFVPILNPFQCRWMALKWFIRRKGIKYSCTHVVPVQPTLTIDWSRPLNQFWHPYVSRNFQNFGKS